MLCPICDNDRVVNTVVFKNNLIFRCNNCFAEFFENYNELRSDHYSKSYYVSWNLREKSVSTEKSKHLTFENLFNHLETKCEGLEGLKDKRFLDIGCATGFMLDIAEKRGCEVYGVELSTWACEQAGERHRNVFNKPLEQCLFKDSFFDIVSMTDVLEHISSPHPFLKEVNRIIKPGGYVLITTPDNLSWSRRMMGRKWFQFKYEHVIYYNKRALANICKVYGFEVIAVGANKKTMCFNYLFSQFMSYRVYFISSFISLIHRMLPMGLNDLPFRVPITGELVAVLRKI